jgi:hypothetical protein
MVVPWSAGSDVAEVSSFRLRFYERTICALAGRAPVFRFCVCGGQSEKIFLGKAMKTWRIAVMASK